MEAHIGALAHAYKKKVYGLYKFDMAALGIRSFQVVPTPSGIVDWQFPDGDDSGALPPSAPVLGQPLAVGSDRLDVPLFAGGTEIPGGSDPYALRAPVGTDKFIDPAAASDSGSGSEASPWKTITQTRVRTLVAGQALWIKNGTLAFPDITGVNDGTSSNRIIIASYPGQFATLTFTSDGRLFNDGAYWDFHTLGLDVINAGLCFGENIQFSGGGSPSTNIRVIDCIGTRSSNSFTDNSGIIFATNGARPIHIIRGSYTGVSGGTQNQSLLWLDYTRDVLILGALLDQCANPFYFKHTDVNNSSTPGGVIQNCIIRRAGRYCGAALNWVQYLNCAFDAADLGCDESGGGVEGGNNITITHCTFLNSDWFMGAEDSAVRENGVFRNNASLGTSRLMDNPYSGTDGNNSADYTANEGAGTNHYYRASTQRTLAGYQSTYATQETHGVAGSIALVGGSTPGSTPANWAMASGVGIGVANDATNCGVDATKLLTVN